MADTFRMMKIDDLYHFVIFDCLFVVLILNKNLELTKEISVVTLFYYPQCHFRFLSGPVHQGCICLTQIVFLLDMLLCKVLVKDCTVPDFVKLI